MDHVDKIIQQWSRERPDLEVSTMAVIGRITRLSIYFARVMEKNFQKHGLNASSFDVLATLRRSGTPYALSPGDLISSTMVTSGTMTNRIDQLVKAGLATRCVNPDDSRGAIISLTDTGLETIDRAIVDHIKIQKKLLSGLSPSDQKILNSKLATLLSSTEEARDI